MLANKFLKIEKFGKSTYYSQNPKNFSGDVFGNKYINNTHCEEKYGRNWHIMMIIPIKNMAQIHQILLW